jgi:dihydroorotase
MISHTLQAAAAAGGVTSFMEMPNTNPQTLTQELLEAKYALGAKHSVVNYSFYMGISNDNLDEALRTDPATVCGLKAFLGSSTGNMLVDDPATLDRLFRKAHMLLAIHAEDEGTIRANMQVAVDRWGEAIPMDQHPIIRSAEACYQEQQQCGGTGEGTWN